MSSTNGWEWLGSQVRFAYEIQDVHLKCAYLLDSAAKPICPSILEMEEELRSREKGQIPPTSSAQADDDVTIIEDPYDIKIVSDKKPASKESDKGKRNKKDPLVVELKKAISEQTAHCKKKCVGGSNGGFNTWNLNCLNELGQNLWVDEGSC